MENVTLSKETIVSTIDIAPTVLEIVLEGIETLYDVRKKGLHANPTTSDAKQPRGTKSKIDVSEISSRLRSAIDRMDGLSFWNFLKALPGQGYADPFGERTDLLISYHGEGNPKCGLSECPAPLDGLWWMPDSSNNTYHCVRTLRRAPASHRTENESDEDSIYCVFYDDEDFVEYYNLLINPHQLGNDYDSLSDTEVERYEIRLQELLS